MHQQERRRRRDEAENRFGAEGNVVISGGSRKCLPIDVQRGLISVFLGVGGCNDTLVEV